MARWKELPGELDPVVVEFIGQLRRVKDRSGLSLPRLAARTGYSASSWERYLSGRLLAPAAAVEALAGIAGADTARLTVLHEMAAECWRRGRAEGRSAGGGGADSDAGAGAGGAASGGAGLGAGAGGGAGAGAGGAAQEGSLAGCGTAPAAHGEPSVPDGGAADRHAPLSAGYAVTPVGDAATAGGDAASPAGNALSPAGNAPTLAGHTPSPTGHAPLSAGYAATAGGHAPSPAGNVPSPAGHALPPGGNASTLVGNTPSPAGHVPSPAGYAAPSAGHASTPDGHTLTPAGSALPPAGNTPPPITRRRLYLTSAAAAVAGAAIAAGVVTAVGSGAQDGSAEPAAVVRSPIYSCAYVRKAGVWTAGNSDTRRDLLEVDMSGPEVAELQCLLRRVGISPGGVDGSFGPLTESAVIAAQKKFHLDVDGQVGPRTWAVLRG